MRHHDFELCEDLTARACGRQVVVPEAASACDRPPHLSCMHPGRRPGDTMIVTV